MPALDARGLLPAGDYEWSWNQFIDAFADQLGDGRGSRRRLLRSLHAVLLRLRAEQVTLVWVGGSFVSAKLLPPDLDVVYAVPEGHPHPHRRDRELARLEESRARRDALKRQHRIDLRTTDAIVVRHGRAVTLLEAFHHTRPDEHDHSEPRGVVVLDVASLPEAAPDIGRTE